MYIFDGNPNGRIMCELSNWNGRIYKVSRNELSVFSQRADAENTGVYFLLGKDENNTDTVYIGEAEKVCTRLKQHLHDADYWSDAIVVISKDDLLNKAHVKYLENRFYCLAQDSGRAVIINSTVPTCSSISEYDEAMLQEFISNARLLVNTLGYKLFDTLEESSVGQQNEPTCFFINAARGAAAASPVVPSMAESLRRLRDSLLEKGIVDADFHFVKDHIFTSPSLAAAVVLGRNANGRAEWKTAGNKALRDVEEDELA